MLPQLTCVVVYGKKNLINLRFIKIKYFSGTMEEGVIVKDEPLDPEYDEAMGSTENGETETEEERNTSNEESSQKFKSMLSNKETGEKAVNSVIDDLLQKNHEILSSTDTALYKPRSKSWYEEYQSQKSGRMLRPKSPTQICVLMQEDLPNLSDSLVELSVGDANVEDIFEKMKHDVVCGLVSKSYAVNNAEMNMQNNFKFYWCNFCPFKMKTKKFYYNMSWSIGFIASVVTTSHFLEQML